jgi:hypothetical protein
MMTSVILEHCLALVLIGVLLCFDKGGSMGHGTQNNPWMKLMGIVSHKDRRHDNPQQQTGSNERTLNM